MQVTRSQVISTARSFLGTPFRHQGRQPGEWLDCAGVLICAGWALGTLSRDFDINDYGRTPDGSSFMEYSCEHLERIDRSDMQPGDVVAMKWGRDPQHFAILGDYLYGGFSLIHAYSNPDGKGRVLEEAFEHRRRNVVAAFKFPGVS